MGKVDKFCILLVSFLQSYKSELPFFSPTKPKWTFFTEVKLWVRT